ncbi:MAG: hypothetical protein KJ025_22610 [Burkholderiales bacterium]|nr:hypothetical protein [Burkholderiales bacterium]
MTKYAALLTAVALAAAAPLASADTAQLELLPKVGGIEQTKYVPEAVAPAGADADFYAHTGGVSPQ